jgi:hypothetical protein
MLKITLLGSRIMCKHCGHEYDDHWREDNKCAVKDCQCPGYETSDEEKGVRLNRNSLWTLAGMILTSPLFFFFVERGWQHSTVSPGRIGLY